MKTYLTLGLMILGFMAASPSAHADFYKEYDRVKILVCELRVAPCPARSVSRLSGPQFVFLAALAQEYRKRNWPAFDAKKAMKSYRQLSECEQYFASTTPVCLAKAISNSR